MTIPFDGEFTVPAAPDAVMDAFADVRRMAALLPGAFIEEQEPDGAWRGGMLVAFGPKKVRFAGKVNLALDRAARTGSMVGRGSADMRAARVETKLQFEVRPLADAAQSLVVLRSTTTMGGVLAEFARTGGPVVARALMEQFAQRLREELSAPVAAPAAPAPAQQLRAEALLWSMLRRWLQQLVGRRPA